MKALRVILYIVGVVLLLRGAVVLDTGASAKLSFPTASAICAVGGALLLFGLYALERLAPLRAAPAAQGREPSTR